MLTDKQIDSLSGQALNNAIRKYIADPNGQDDKFLAIKGFSTYDYCNDLHLASEIFNSVRKEPLLMFEVFSDKLDSYLVEIVHENIPDDSEKHHFIEARGETEAIAYLRAALKVQMKHLQSI